MTFRCRARRRVLVLYDLAHVLRQIIDRARDLGGEQIRRLPRSDPRLAAEYLKETLIAGHVRGDRHATTFSNKAQDFDEVLIGKVRRGARFRDPELTQVALELLLCGVRRIETEHVHTLAGGQLEAGEDMDAPTLRGVLESRHTAHVVVVGHGEDGDADLDSLLDDGSRVSMGISASELSTEGAGVVVRVHL